MSGKNKIKKGSKRFRAWSCRPYSHGARSSAGVNRRNSIGSTPIYTNEYPAHGAFRGLKWWAEVLWISPHRHKCCRMWLFILVLNYAPSWPKIQGNLVKTGKTPLRKLCSMYTCWRAGPELIVKYVCHKASLRIYFLPFRKTKTQPGTAGAFAYPCDFEINIH